MTYPDQVLPPPTPDWSTIPEQIHCPLCEYNLRGLTEPRCPECGYRFEWSELLDPNRRIHPYIFEHHPERNVWSFRETLTNGLRPQSFWRSLHPAQPSRAWRLLNYAMLTSMPLLLTWIAYCITTIWQYYPKTAQILPMLSGLRNTPPPDFLRIVHVTFDWSLAKNDLFQAWLGCILWPWLTLAGLMIFRWSMKRANIKRIHVMRCLVYSADLSLLIFPVFLLVGAEASRLDPLQLISLQTSQAYLNVAMFVALLLFTYRLVCAYRFYLRFDRPVATVLSAEVISALVLWKLLLVIQGY